MSKQLTHALLILACAFFGFKAEAAREILNSQQRANFEKQLRSFNSTNCQVIQVASIDSHLTFTIRDGNETLVANIDSYDSVSKSFVGYAGSTTVYEMKADFTKHRLTYLNIDQYSYKVDRTSDTGVRKDLVGRISCGI